MNAPREPSPPRRLPSAALPLVLATLVLAACAGGRYPPPPGVGQDASAPYEYIIGEGDVLNIFVWGYEDLSTSVQVRPDGRITTRLIEDLQASGKTPTELAREIEQRYVDFVNRPIVTVSVDDFVGAPSQRVKIIGASAEPKTVPFESGMTVLDLIRKGDMSANVALNPGDIVVIPETWF